VANVARSPHTEHKRTEEAPVEIIRASGCECEPDLPVPCLDLSKVAALLRCTDCGRPHTAIAGDVFEVIDELLALYSVIEDLDPLPPETGTAPRVSAVVAASADSYSRCLAQRGVTRPPSGAPSS
jgi:hypothetical protein